MTGLDSKFKQAGCIENATLLGAEDMEIDEISEQRVNEWLKWDINESQVFDAPSMDLYDLAPLFDMS